MKFFLFATLFGFLPKCACGAKPTETQIIEAGGHKVGVMLTCDKHWAEGDIKYAER